MCRYYATADAIDGRTIGIGDDGHSKCIVDGRAQIDICRRVNVYISVGVRVAGCSQCGGVCADIVELCSSPGVRYDGWVSVARTIRWRDRGNIINTWG